MRARRHGMFRRGNAGGQRGAAVFPRAGAPGNPPGQAAGAEQPWRRAHKSGAPGPAARCEGNPEGTPPKNIFIYLPPSRKERDRKKTALARSKGGGIKLSTGINPNRI